MHEVDHYLKDVGAVLSGTIHEKENYLTMLCNDIAEFVDVNPSASINNIIGEFGTPEKHADVFLENKMKDKPETIRKRLVFHRVIAIAAVLVVAIIGIVYACALIENHKEYKNEEENIGVNCNFYFYSLFVLWTDRECYCFYGY